jgi:hypothetical protein
MTASDELPVYIVSGPNWECEVLLDEDDASLDKIDQMMEAATKAVEILNGVLPSDNFSIIDKEEVPYLGSVIQVHLKNTNPNKAEFIPSFIALANGGFYKESHAAREILEEQERELATTATKEAKKVARNRNKKAKKPIQLRRKSKKDNNGLR